MEYNQRVVQTQTQTQQRRSLPEIIQYQQTLRADIYDLVVVMDRRLRKNLMYEGITEMEKNTESLNSEHGNDYDESTAMLYNEDDIGYRMQGDGPRALDIAEDRNKFLSTEQLFRDDLERQMEMFKFSSAQKDMGLFFYYSLTPNGFLDPLYNSVEFLVNRGEHEESLITSTLSFLQEHVTPAGLFGRDVKHSLEIQARRLPDSIEKFTLLKIMELRYDDLLEQKLDDLKAFLRVDNLELINDAYALLEKMQPIPIPESDKTAALKKRGEPDFIISEENGAFVARATEKNELHIKVNAAYKRAMALLAKENKTRDPQYAFLRKENSEINQAIYEVHDRRKRLEKVGSFIANAQAKFLRSGDKNDILPLLQKDVAEQFDVTPSTISRITSEKFFQMETGAIVNMVELLSLGVGQKDGVRVAIKEAKQQLIEFLKSENHNAPLTPMELKKKMEDMGYEISTARVRHFLNDMKIPDVRERKAIYAGARENNEEVFKVMEKMNLVALVLPQQGSASIERLNMSM